MKFSIQPSTTKLVASSTVVEASTNAPRQLRTVSNLKADPKFVIPLRQRSHDALYFYNNKFKGGIKEPELVWMSLVSQVLFPDWKQVHTSGAVKSKFKNLLKSTSESWTLSGATAMVSIRKDDAKQEFRVTVPVLVVEKSMSWPGMSKAAWLASGDPAMQVEGFGAMIEKARVQDESNPQSHLLSSLTQSGNISTNFVAFAKSTRAVLTTKSVGSYCVALLELSFSKLECEYLCNTEWITIRPLDMYGLVTAWVNGYFGRRGRSPSSTIPLADIAKESDSKVSVPRLSKEGVLINEDGELYAIPTKLNSIYQYEDATTSALTHEDGSFSAVSPSGERIKPPAAMPVYIDWVNLKFAYTSLDGRLLVMNLDRSQPLNITHARKFLETTLEDDLAQNFLTVSMQLAKFAGIMQEEPATFLKSLVKEVQDIGMARESYQSAAEIPLVCISEYASDSNDSEGSPSKAGEFCQKFVSYLNQTRKFITVNPTNAYARYSVTTVCISLAEMIVFLEYGSQYSAVITEDNTKRKAYSDQAVDPDFELSSVPLVLEGRGLMPHQTKLQNLLKDRPDNAMLPVDAGGGKCLHGDTWVHTSKGLLSLKEIYDTYAGVPSKLDSRFRKVTESIEVMNIDGQLEQIDQVFKRRGNLWELKLDDDTSFKGLKEHKFWTDTGWKEIGSLKIGDWLCAPKKINIFGKNSLVDLSAVKSPEELYSGGHSKIVYKDRFERAVLVHKRLSKGLNVTPDLGFLLGSLVAEGSGSTFCNTDLEFIDKYNHAYGKVFGIAPDVQISTPREHQNLGVHLSKAGSMYEKAVLFSLISGTNERIYSHEFEVPVCIRSANKETQKAFLSAWFEGDGEIRGIESGRASNRLMGGSCSQKLVIGLIQMLRNFGISARGGKYNLESPKAWMTFQGGRGELLTKIGSCLIVPSNQIAIFEKEIGFACKRKQVHLNKSVRAQALAMDKSKQAVINFESLGRHMRVPSALVHAVLDKVEAHASTLTYVSEYISKHGTTACEVRTHSLSSVNRAFANLGHDTLGGIGYASNSKGKDSQSTRRAAVLVYEMARHHPLLKNLRKDKDFQSVLRKLKSALNCVWSKVESVKNLKVADYVYDLTLPSTHSYTANGYFSHNTASILYEVLREISEDDGKQGLCLVLCPSHLVAQYVKEFAFFTGSRVNVIPITSYTIRRQGFKRLEAMIRNAPQNTVVVSDYNAILLGNSSIAYGPSVVKTFPVIEFIRQFHFKYVACDECFVAGTLVETDNGSVPVESIIPGDLVKNAAGFSEVEAVSERGHHGDMIEVSFNQTLVTCTPNHPWFTDHGWVTAENLTTSHALISTDYAQGLMFGKDTADTESSNERVALRGALEAELKEVATLCVDPSTILSKNILGIFLIDSVVRIKATAEIVKVYNLQVKGHPSYSVGGALVHNCHFLKNGSNRNAAVARLIIDIKRKRLASGTMVADTITDLVRQTALMDPTIFGTYDDFSKKYALETRGSKVVAWKPGSELAIKRQLGRHVVIAEARRKEWAAILPHPIIKFRQADMTPNQMKAYHEVLNHVIETIMEKAKENQAIADLLSGKNDPDEMGVDLDSLLKPFLARLEAFIVAPGKDPYGATILTGEDLISPKVHVINQICKEHLEQGLNGKILIFTNYHSSTDAIWEGLGMVGLQDQAIYYTAGEKEECGAEFDKNPKKKILVGVEQSLNTGLNLQHASRLIRVSTCWTPGTLEQGDSRVNRPNIKIKETRQDIYYDTIVANNTIDVTKVSYLMAKSISKAKFDEAGNPRFDELEVPAMLAMTLDNIRSENDFNSTLSGYFEKFQAYQQAQFAEFQEYREKNKTTLFDSAGNLKMSKLERAPNPPGVALMRRIPYVPGTELYKSSDLGLLRYDDFLSKHHASIEDDEEEGVSDDEGEGGDDDEKEVSEKELSAEKLAALMKERELCLGVAVHTDYGDGEIKRVNTKTLSVALPSGEMIKVRKLSAFIITRANTNGKDIRNQLLKLTGDVPIDAPIDVLEIKIDPKIESLSKKELFKDKTKSSESAAITMDLSFTIANDFLGISIENIDDERAVKVAQGNGFKFTPSYYAAHIKQPKQMLDFFRLLKDKGFSVDSDGNDACAEAYLHFKANRTSSTKFFGYANKVGISNFFRREFKPKADQMFVMPYPLIQDGKLYVCLPKTGHPGSLNAMRKTTQSTLKWLVYESGTELINFVASKPEASSLIQRLVGLGVHITNLPALKKEFNQLKVSKRKST